jgi:hypothetical protein
MAELKVSRCISLKEFYKLRGKNYSPTTIRRWIDSGILQKGKHFIHLPSQIILVDPEMVDQAILKLNK